MATTTYDELTHDDLVAFGNVLAHVWRYDDTEEALSNMLSYFEKPHKWERDYRKWRDLGGTLDESVLSEFEDWYERKDEVADDDDA